MEMSKTMENGEHFLAFEISDSYSRSCSHSRSRSRERSELMDINITNISNSTLYKDCHRPRIARNRCSVAVAIEIATDSLRLCRAAILVFSKKKSNIFFRGSQFQPVNIYTGRKTGTTHTITAVPRAQSPETRDQDDRMAHVTERNEKQEHGTIRHDTTRHGTGPTRNE